MLQRSLLVNRIPIEAITSDMVTNGFLVGEKSPDYLKSLLITKRAELIVVCKEDAAGDDNLAGYAILAPLSDFEKAYASPEDGIFEALISSSEWEEFVKNPNHHYIDQIAVRPDLRGQGIGSMIVGACKNRSPDGLLADILFEPKPYNNAASYNLFRKLGFRDVGKLFIRKFPAFRPCSTRVVSWKPETNRRF